jgi:hypothetical protein
MLDYYLFSGVGGFDSSGAETMDSSSDSMLEMQFTMFQIPVGKQARMFPVSLDKHEE